MKQHIREIRSFNRFYTSHLELLNATLFTSGYSLTEARVLFEIGNPGKISTSQLSQVLLLDKGYLSRVINKFVKRGLVRKVISSGDKRSSDLILLQKGRHDLTMLKRRSDEQIDQLTAALNTLELNSVVAAMRTIRLMLTTGYDKRMLADEVTVRDTLQPGDLGYMIYLHGKLYAEESGYSFAFEGYVAKTFYEFTKQYDDNHDRIWLASYNDEIVASIAILKRPRRTAQLRWFLVHPMLRGTGIGSKLLETALTYCREKFDSVYLMTADTQHKALDMYRRAGFILTKSVEVEQWGIRLREERYDLIIK